MSSTNKKAAQAAESAEMQKLRLQSNKSLNLIQAIRSSFHNFKA